VALAANAARRSRIWRAASCAALPFRSAPVDAAVAEVLATLVVSVAVARTRLEAHAQLVRHDLRHLGVEALAHLGAAVVHQHRAVGVDVHQRAGLVEVRTLNEMPNFTGVSARPFLSTGLRVERGDRGAARAVVAGGDELVGQLVNDVVGDALAVRRDVALADAVEVGAPHVERVLAERARDRVHHVTSIANAPCGPPKPRNAVLLCVLVLPQ
jgi:hypothetical protein